jgi:ATP-binding cassette subfamily C protein LapB
LGDLPFLVVFLAAIYWVAGGLVIIPVIAGAILLGIVFAIQLRIKNLVQSQFAASATKNTIATELLAALPTVQLAGAKEWAGNRWEAAASEQLRQGLKTRFWNTIAMNILVIFQGATTIAILAFGAQMVMNAQLSPGALFAANLLAARCLAPIAGVASLGARFAQMKLAHEQIVQIMQLEGENQTSGKVIAAPDQPAKIEMHAVTHRYAPHAQEALKDVSLTFQQGEWTAIIGGIGSGKSTLLDILAARTTPTAGNVTADTLSLLNIHRDEWRDRIGIVPQAPGFFAGSLRENLDMGRGLSDADLMQALEFAGASNWVERTGLGLNMEIAERGHGLSGGQLQCVAVARAIASRPGWLLMDEPTNHLDGQAEKRVMAGLEMLRGQCTVIAVTHRPALIEHADRLIVMENGAVKMHGPRDAILAELQTHNRALQAEHVAAGAGATR